MIAFDQTVALQTSLRVGGRPHMCDGATGEALRAITELDLEELQAVDPPRGYGRD